MSQNSVIFRYANAIFTFSVEKKCSKEVKIDMENFCEIYKKNRDLQLLLRSDIIPHLTKAAILKKIFSTKLNDLTIKAFDLIAKKGRESLLFDIATEFIQCFNRANDMEEVTVTTAYVLNNKESNAFYQLSKEITKKTPIMIQNVDPNIIGGYLLKFKDQQLNLTISSHLQSIKQSFT